ncbi:cupin domain-containing protein [Streptomyces avicenniae]|uniref:cupin domain-containing protein n=1 Tax=Streptomyces avicenniae TaxID=500153 RepID=UPI00069C78DE|nr:cupin domain-containing protein [Streptomyces avicenniae]
MPQYAHVRSLLHKEPSLGSDSGTITELTSADLPLLRRLSIRRTVLAPLGVREPHWHANASELTYCVRGEALVTIFGTEDAFDSFTVTAGQMFFVPSGALHHIENTGQSDAEFISGFTHESPEDFGISAAFGAMTDAVLGNTYGLPSSAFATLRRSTTDTRLGSRRGPADVPLDARRPNLHRFDVEAMAAPIDLPSGSAKTARKQFWPILENISMYSLRVLDEGMREPHWHPVTAEMGYVHEGQARMTVLNPDGSAETYLLRPGDVYFVPRAYPHQIEDVGEGDLHFLVYFDQATPADIGYKASVSGFAHEVLAAAFATTPEAMPRLPFTPLDPLFVDRVNPVDPVS